MADLNISNYKRRATRKKKALAAFMRKLGKTTKKGLTENSPGNRPRSMERSRLPRLRQLLQANDPHFQQQRYQSAYPHTLK
jgi:hypothetical protein